MGTLLLFVHPLHNFLLTPGALLRSPAFSLVQSLRLEIRKGNGCYAGYLRRGISFFFCFAGEREGRRESLRSRLFPTLATVARFLALGTVIILQLARVDYPRLPPPQCWWF